MFHANALNRRSAEPDHGEASSSTERFIRNRPGRLSACLIEENELAREPETEVTPTKARQGRRGFPILLVLIVGLVLAMGAWWVAEMYGVWIAPETPIADSEHTID